GLPCASVPAGAVPPSVTTTLSGTLYSVVECAMPASTWSVPPVGSLRPAPTVPLVLTSPTAENNGVSTRSATALRVCSILVDAILATDIKTAVSAVERMRSGYSSRHADRQAREYPCRQPFVTPGTRIPRVTNRSPHPPVPGRFPRRFANLRMVQALL